MQSPGLKLSENILKSFCVTKEFKDCGDQINNLDFSDDGQHLIASSDDDFIMLYECANEGIHKLKFPNKKYGVSNICFTHNSDSIIYSSNKTNDDIRYQSLKDRKFIQYFAGHRKLVNCISMHPVENTFLSSSLDKTVCIWDLNQANSLRNIPMTGVPIACFDPEGIVFAAAIDSETIKLFDLRQCQKGPFSVFKYPKERDCEWTQLKFSPNGRYLLVSTNSSAVRLVDAINGEPLQTLKIGCSNTQGLPLETSFTPDSTYVLSGSEEGKIYISKAETGSLSTVISCKTPVENPPIPALCVKFNPCYMMLASSHNNSLKFWLPTYKDE